MLESFMKDLLSKFSVGILSTPYMGGSLSIGVSINILSTPCMGGSPYIGVFNQYNMAISYG